MSHFFGDRWSRPLFYRFKAHIVDIHPELKHLGFLASSEGCIRTQVYYTLGAHLGQNLIAVNALTLTSPGQTQVIANGTNGNLRLLLIIHFDQISDNFISLKIHRSLLKGDKCFFFSHMVSFIV